MPQLCHLKPGRQLFRYQAALFLAAKQLYNKHFIKSIDIYLGFKDTSILLDYFKKYANKLVVDVGNNISGKVNIHKYDYIFSCGPEEMMKSVVERLENLETKIK